MTSRGGCGGVGEVKVEPLGVSPSSSRASSPSGSRRSQGSDNNASSAAPVSGDHGESPQVRDLATRQILHSAYSNLR
jgi:hypothetical protein